MIWKGKLGISISPAKTKFGPLFRSGDLERGLRESSDIGYDGVEVSLRDSTAFDRGRFMVLLEKLGLEVFTIATGQSFIEDGFSLFHHDKTFRDAAVERILGHIEFAAGLKARIILGGICGSIDPEAGPFDDSRRKGEEAIYRCLEEAVGKDVTLLIEPINRYESNVFNRLQDALDLIERAGSSHLKVLADTYHMNIEEASMEESIRRAGGNLGFIHFADSNRRAPGMGHIDFPGIVQALDSAGYSGPAGIEILPLPDDYTGARQAYTFLKG